MKLIPIRDRIVVRLIEAETTTAGGLIIPDNAAEKPSQADVIAVGEGKINDDALKFGQAVILTIITFPAGIY